MKRFMPAGLTDGHRIRQVARGRAGHCIESELFCLGDGHGHDTVLERQCRMVHGVVLQVNFPDTPRAGKVPRLHQRCIARVKSRDGIPVDRQEFAVPPHIMRPGLDLLARHIAFDPLVIVGYLKRTEAELADIDGVDLVFPAAFDASQALDIRHRRFSSEAMSNSVSLICFSAIVNTRAVGFSRSSSVTIR
jgi:hypothetical protein